MTVYQTPLHNNVVRNEFDLLAIPKYPRIMMRPARISEIEKSIA